MPPEVKPIPDPIPDPNKPVPDPAGVKPPVDPNKPPEGVKPPEPEPGSQTDPVQLLKALQETREKLKIAEIRADANVQQPPVQQQPPAQQQQPMPNIQVEIDKAWDEDPKKAVRMEMAMGFQWYDQINAGLDQQRDTCRGKYEDFNKYESNAMGYVRTLPLQQRNINGVVEMAYLIEKGKVADAIKDTATTQAVDAVIKKLQAGESIQGISAGSGTPNAPVGTKLTDDQLKACEAMGIPPEEYLKNIRQR